MADSGLKRRVAWNTAVLAAAQAAVMAIQFAVALILSRHLGPERFGHYNYVFAFYALFLSVGELGVGTVAVREVSRRREQASEILAALLTLRVLMAALALAAALVTVWSLQTSAELRRALVLFSLILFVPALQLPLTVLRADLKPGYMAAAGVTARAIGLGLVWWLAGRGAGVMAMLAAYLASEVVYLAAGLGYTRRLIRIGFAVDRLLWASALRSGLVVGLIGLCASLINRLDFLMLERMTDMTAVGLYAAAYRVTNTLEALPLIVMGSVFPLISRYRDDAGRLRRIYGRSLSALAALGLGMGIVVTVFAPLIVRILFGGEYGEATRALRVLVWSSACVCAFLTSTNFLIGVGRERGLLVLYVFGAALNAALNLVLIPRWGIVGAALATTATYAMVLAGSTVAAVGALARGRVWPADRDPSTANEVAC